MMNIAILLHNVNGTSIRAVSIINIFPAVKGTLIF